LYRELIAAAVLALATPAPTVAVAAPNATLHLEVARNEAQREYGLMNRTSIPAHTGMIFVFPGESQLGFWMKDTLVPLDMIFVGADGTVRRVFADVPVLPSPPPPDNQIPQEIGVGKFVIELAAGEAAKDGIAQGVKLDVSMVPGALP
jgi:uncharacterized membrane protein (UPF0127 family)